MDRLGRGVGDILYDAGTVFTDFECGPKKICVIGAPPGAGKTTLTMQYTFSALEQNKSLIAVIANAEMPFDVLLQRELARRSGVHSKALRFATLTASQWQRVEASASEIEPLLARIKVMDGPYTCQRLNQIGNESEPGLLVVDYLQKFTPGDDPRLGVNAVMAGLRLMASEGWGVLALSATVRTRVKGGSGHDSSQLNMASFKESGEIEFNADSLYLLRDNDAVDGNEKIRSVTLDCVKNRHGEKVSVDMVFNMPQMSFERRQVEPEPQRHTEFDEYSGAEPYEFVDDNPFSGEVSF